MQQFEPQIFDPDYETQRRLPLHERRRLAQLDTPVPGYEGLYGLAECEAHAALRPGDANYSHSARHHFAALLAAYVLHPGVAAHWQVHERIQHFRRERAHWDAWLETRPDARELFRSYANNARHFRVCRRGPCRRARRCESSWHLCIFAIRDLALERAEGWLAKMGLAEPVDHKPKYSGRLD